MTDILSLNDNKAIGQDNVPVFYLKIGRHVITQSIINHQSHITHQKKRLVII